MGKDKCSACKVPTGVYCMLIQSRDPQLKAGAQCPFGKVTAASTVTVLVTADPVLCVRVSVTGSELPCLQHCSLQKRMCTSVLFQCLKSLRISNAVFDRSFLFINNYFTVLEV